MPLPGSVGEGQREYTTYEGQYTATHFAWFTTSEDGTPKLVEQGGRAVARCRFLQGPEDTEGPPGTFELGEIPLLVKAFGGDPAQLPVSTNGNYTALLVAAQKLAKGTPVNFKVKNGWVRNYTISGFEFPEGHWQVKLVSLRPRNEVDKPYWEESGGPYGGGYFFVKVKIVSDLSGKPSVYDGVTGDFIANYANNHLTPIVLAFAPEIQANEVEYADETNALPEIEAYAIQAGRIALLNIKRNKKNGRLVAEWPSLQYVRDSEAEAPVVITQAKAYGNTPLEVLYNVVAAKCPQPAFVAGGQLSPDGKRWAAENVLPAVKKLGIEPHTPDKKYKFDQFTGQEIFKILTAMDLDTEAGWVSDLLSEVEDIPF